MATYVPLWCKSYYSFLEGASAPDDLVARAAALGLPAVALTDRDGVYGVPAAHQAAREAGVSLIIGSEVTVADGGGGVTMRAGGLVDLSTIVGPECGSTATIGDPKMVDRSTITLIASDRRGYTNLCRLLTKGRLRSPKGSCLVTWDEVATHAEGLIALWGSGNSLLTREDSAAAMRTAGPLSDAFGDRLYALVARHCRAADPRAEARLRRRARRFGLATVAAVEVLYHTRHERPLQDVLTCLREGVTVAEAGLKLRPNDRHALLTPRAFARLFADDPAAVARTLEVAARCSFDLGDLRYRYPAEHLPFGMSTARWLDQLVRGGARERFGDPVPPEMRHASGHRTGADPRAGLRRLLPDDVRDRALLPRAGHPLPGARLGGQLGRLLLPEDHGGQPARGGPAVRALHLARAGRAAGHRPGHRARPARGGHPARLREVRARPRGDGGQRGAVPAALGHPRGGQGAGVAGGEPGPAGEAGQPLPRRRDARRDAAPSRLRPRGAAASRTSGAWSTRSRSCRATFRSTPAASCWGTNRCTTWCPSRTRPCPAAPSSSGTSTRSNRWACSRSTCWGWAR